MLAIFGKIIGDLVQARWFAALDLDGHDGIVHLGLAHFIAIGVIIAVWAFNIFGIRPIEVAHLPHGGAADDRRWSCSSSCPTSPATGTRATSTRPSPGRGAASKLVFVCLFILGWSSWASEVCATFAPEYKTERDTHIALRSSALFVVGVFALLPLGLGGVTGVPAVATQEGQFYSTAFQTIAGHTLGTIFLICLIASLLLSMSSSTADGSRALYGISRVGHDDQAARRAQPLPRSRARDDGRPVRQRAAGAVHLQQPGDPLHEQHRLRPRATCSRVSGFLLLRKDRPNWPRPIKLAGVWVPIAGFMTAARRVPADRRRRCAEAQRLRQLDRLRRSASGMLVASVLLFVFRRVVQDGERVHFREEVPTMPADGEWPEGYGPAAVPAVTAAG